jgi:peptidoglycan biosynthesis protein MviN/MurJ (putative lipid II flippase)
LASPLAEAVSFGEMDTSTGVTLIAVSLASIAVGVMGETCWVIATQASYARRDARSPLISSVVRLAVSLVGLLIAAFLDGSAVLIAVGAAVSVGDVAGAWYLWRRVGRGLPTVGLRLSPPFARALIASLLMAGPAYLVAVTAPPFVVGTARDILGVAAAAVTGAALYFGLQRAWRSPELSALLGGLGQFR